MLAHPRSLIVATLRLLVAFGLVLMLAPAALAQSSGLIDVKVNAGNKDFPLALPYAQGNAAEAKAIWEVVRRDLELTGSFRFIDPDATIDSGGVEDGTFKFADWRTLNAAALAKIAVRQVPGGMTAEVWIYDVNAGEKIVARRFSGRSGQERALGHALAREILIALTGDAGFFGSKIAAVRRGKNKEIVVFDIDGAGQVYITRNGSINLSPTWSPDARNIAWTSYKRNNPDVYVKELATGRTRVLSAAEGINIGAAWSPDGSKIALSRSQNGDADIYVLDARTGKIVNRLTTGGGIDVAPAWSPDGSKIAFSSERSGGSQVFIMSATGGDARRVSRQGNFNTDPVWSPDGTRIAFVGRNPKFDVFVAEVDSGQVRRVTQNMGDNEDPSWSPDSNYLVFSSNRSGRSEVWLATANGRHQIQLTEGGGYSQPVWSPRR